MKALLYKLKRCYLRERSASRLKSEKNTKKSQEDMLTGNKDMGRLTGSIRYKRLAFLPKQG
jgi:hypothetical protein